MSIAVFILSLHLFLSLSLFVNNLENGKVNMEAIITACDGTAGHSHLSYSLSLSLLPKVEVPVQEVAASGEVQIIVDDPQAGLAELEESVLEVCIRQLFSSPPPLLIGAVYNCGSS